jgi:hypothetical protein
MMERMEKFKEWMNRNTVIEDLLMFELKDFKISDGKTFLGGECEYFLSTFKDDLIDFIKSRIFNLEKNAKIDENSITFSLEEWQEFKDIFKKKYERLGVRYV